MIRLICWNIQAGPIDAQLAHLLGQRDADLFVLTEYVRLRPQEPPSPTLAGGGWDQQHAPVVGPDRRSVLIAAREPLEAISAEDILALGDHAEILRHAVAAAFLPARDLTVIGVYMPYADGPAKQTLWAALHRYAATHTADRFIIAGDMNSCERDDAASSYPSSPEALAAMRRVTIDAWSAKGDKGLPAGDRYTWYWKGAEQHLGRRLDYVFLSRALEPALKAARHDHDVRERELSDHSALIVDLTGDAIAECQPLSAPMLSHHAS